MDLKTNQSSENHISLDWSGQRLNLEGKYSIEGRLSREEMRHAAFLKRTAWKFAQPSSSSTM